MVATAQRFCEIRPEIEIRWEKRSLQEFADYPIERLAEQFDLLVIDHPFVGCAAANQILLPLDEHLPDSFLADQARQAVGQSHESYFYAGHQWAVAIDAATPVSSWRPDLLEVSDLPIPQTWEELLGLAKRGVVALPGLAVDCLMNFYMFCATLGEAPFRQEVRVVSREIGTEALLLLREIIALCSPQCFSWNPIAVYEAMAGGNTFAYCPFAYGYSNYSRGGYGRTLLLFGDIVCLGRYGRLRPTLGGTGLAVSALCTYREPAVDYARFVASPDCQRTLYFESGGQPAHRLAWLDPEVNRASHGFFQNTLEVLERSYLRPRYDGYIHFQIGAARAVQQYLGQGGNPEQVLQQLEELYLRSRR
jgi:multiple sugar transport system substrate-binding protein